MIFPKGILLALKGELEEVSLLEYVDKVDIRKYTGINLPDFDYYCIVINPLLATSEPYAAAQRQILVELELVLLGKILNGNYDAIMADSPEASPPNVGILAMYEDVYRFLYKNTLGGAIELYPGLIELDRPIRFDIFQIEEREEFIMEARMGYRLKGARFIDFE